jgi:alpha-L-fucosidase
LKLFAGKEHFMRWANLSRRRFLQLTGSASIAAAFAPISTSAEEGDTEVKPTKAQADWMKLGYGLFIHFGPNTIQGVSWGGGKFPAQKVVFEKLDVAQWAHVAAEAGMKYAVLTSKHVDGFCLWPSKHTEYSVKNSPMQKDIARLFVDEFKKAGIKTGFYYCLLDKNFGQFENDQVYNEYVRNQITELLTDYGDVLELWFDGAWVKDHPTKDWPWDPNWEKYPNSGLKHGERWQWNELYGLVHKLQPNCLVMNNSSSDRPGGVKYLPVDVRTAERFDFVWKGRICEPITEPVFIRPDGQKVYLPLEYCDTLPPGWFWKKGDDAKQPPVATICDWYQRARKTQANLLLNAGPDATGVIPDYNHRNLSEAAKLLNTV